MLGGVLEPGAMAYVGDRPDSAPWLGSEKYLVSILEFVRESNSVTHPRADAHVGGLCDESRHEVQVEVVSEDGGAGGDCRRVD